MEMVDVNEVRNGRGFTLSLYNNRGPKIPRFTGSKSRSEIVTCFTVLHRLAKEFK